MEIATSTTNWSFTHKITFRVSFIFFVLNTLPFPLSIIPYVNELVYGIDELVWNFLVQLAGKIFFGMDEITTRPNGSGDTTWNWIQIFVIVFASVLGALIWSVLDRHRKNYEKVGYWFNVLLRYYLAYTMFTYGFVKVFPLQFGNITTYRLFERLGDMSPMGLLWTFMAYSPGYQLFSGFMEVIGGVLLLFRRTTTLGAVVCIGVLANIFAMNMFFDVPVKIYSGWLLLIGIYLAFDDVQRLWNFFILNRATLPKDLRLFSTKRWFRISRIVLKIIFIGGFCGMMFYQSWESSQYKDVPKTAIYGPYRVESFERNGATSATDTLRWQEVFVDRRGTYDMVSVTNEDGLRKRLNFTKDDQKHTLTLTDIGDTTHYALSYLQPDSLSLILKGKYQKDSLQISMKKMDRKKFLLTSRGFRWINEVPFNK